jgi:SAM-dependent methyltransferase
VNNKLAGVRFICVDCKNPVRTSEFGVICDACQIQVDYKENGTLAFVNIDDGVVSDPLDRLKSRLKKFGKLYNVLIDVISPVYPLATIDRKRIVKLAAKTEDIIVNLGSGSSDFGPRVINVDIFPYSSVDIVSSIDCLPFEDASIDQIINIAVLEHVPNPIEVVAEFHRVLKPGGKLYCFVPFIQGFHASPWDYQRYTKPGLIKLFSQFEIVSIKSAGPTSGMLWTFQEWIALLFSFGSKKIHSVIWLVILLVTFPIKYMDFFLRHHSLSENISSGFSVEAVKNIVSD